VSFYAKTGGEVNVFKNRMVLFADYWISLMSRSALHKEGSDAARKHSTVDTDFQPAQQAGLDFNQPCRSTLDQYQTVMTDEFTCRVRSAL